MLLTMYSYENKRSVFNENIAISTESKTTPTLTSTFVLNSDLDTSIQVLYARSDVRFEQNKEELK